MPPQPCVLLHELLCHSHQHMGPVALSLLGHPARAHTGAHLSSRLMSTPTEGGAASMSVMRGRNLCRISFREVQPVWT